MTRPEIPAIHHHPVGMTCVACVIAGIDVSPTDIQAGRLKRADRLTKEEAA